MVRFPNRIMFKQFAIFRSPIQKQVMKSLLCALFFLTGIVVSAFSQQQSAFDEPQPRTLYSEALGDSVNISLHIPLEIHQSSGLVYPVIYLLDRQNDINYHYNLQTIDYLSMLSAMPAAVVVGIEFPNRQRGPWTNPNETGGKADDFIAFLADELNPLLKKDFPVADYNLLIGHSRTAIFSLYALSVRPDFFNSVVANSASNFDFGDEYQQEQFETFLQGAAKSDRHYQIHFSSGTAEYRDLHEPSVDAFATYLENRDIPENIQWQQHKAKVDHFAIPGMTVNWALVDIFLPYSTAVNRCFDIIKDSTYADGVPWKLYRAEYANAAEIMGYPVQPDLLFFNSFASDYTNDYNDLFKENKDAFCLEVLQEAIKYYPRDFGFHLWLSELYAGIGNEAQFTHHVQRGRGLVTESKMLTDAEREALLGEIDILLDGE